MSAASRLFIASGLIVGAGALISGAGGILAPGELASQSVAGVLGAVAATGFKSVVDLATNIFAGFLQKRAEEKRPGIAELLADDHVAALVGEGMSACLQELRKEMERAGTPFVGLRVRQFDALLKGVPDAYRALCRGSGPGIVQSLSGDGVPDLLRGYLELGPSAFVGEEGDWIDFLRTVDVPKGLKAEPEVLAACAVTLRTKLCSAIYALVVHNASINGEAAAAVSLRIQASTLRVMEEIRDRHAEAFDFEIHELAKIHGHGLLQFRQMNEVKAIVADSFELLSRLDRGQGLILRALFDLGQGQQELGDVLASLSGQVALLVQKNVTAAKGRGARSGAIPWHPPARGVLLLGREGDLKQVVDALMRFPVVVLYGAGGIGKTALAGNAIVALASDQDNPGVYSGGIFQHDFYRRPSHNAALTSLLEQAGLDTAGITDLELEVQTMFGLATQLIYLEGGERAEDLGALLRLLGDSRVLLTTRNAQHRQRGHPIELRTLAVNDAAQIIRYHQTRGEPNSPPQEWGPWEQLAAYLGGHALACERAGRILEADGIGPEQLLGDVQQEGVSVLGGDEREHESVEVLLRRDANALASTGPEALAVWHALSLGALAPVPLDPVWAGAGLSRSAVMERLEKLETRGLVRWEMIAGETFGKLEKAWMLTHALLSEFGRRELAQSDESGGLAHGLSGSMTRLARWWFEYLHHAFNDGAIPGGEMRYRALTPHLDSLLTRLEEAADLDSLATGYSAIGQMHFAHGRYPAAEQLARNSLRIAERHYGPDDQNTLTAINVLGHHFEKLGDVDNAEPLFLRALEGRRRVLGEDHPHTLQSMNNLASVLKQKGDWGGAEELLQECLDRRAQILGPEDRETLSTLHNLASVYELRGDLPEAELLYRQVVEARIRVLGEEHLDTITSMGNLAVILEENGNFDEAEPLLHKVFEVRKRLLGISHPDTCLVAYNLAIMLRRNRPEVNVVMLARQAYEGLKQAYGEEDSRTEDALELLSDLGDDEF